MMHVILYLALLGATAFALPVYNENNHKSLVYERTGPVDINPITQTQVFTQTERGPPVSNIIPEKQIREHQPGRIPQNYDKDANGLLDQSEYEGWRAAENIVVLPFEAVDTNDDRFVNSMELPYLLWSSPNEINKALPGYDDDKYLFNDMMLTNAFFTDDVSDMVNIPKETYMSIIVHTKPAGDGVKPLNVNPVNNFPDDDNTEEQEHVDYVDKKVISEVNPAEEEFYQPDMVGKESSFPQSEEPEYIDPVDEEVIDRVNPAEGEIIDEVNPDEEGNYRPKEDGIIRFIHGKENTFPQSEEPESMDPVDEEDIDEINPAEEGIFQPEEGGLIDSMIGKESTFPQSEEPESMDPVDEEDIDEINPAEEGIFQPEEGGLVDSMVGKESTFPQLEEPESMDPVDEEDIDEINPAEEGISQTEEGSLIDFMVGEENTFPQSEEPESMDPVDEEDIDEINPTEEGIYQPEEGGLIDSMVGKESTFPQSEEPESMDPVDEEAIDEINPVEEGNYQPEEEGLIDSMIFFPQLKKTASINADAEEINSNKEGIYHPADYGQITPMVKKEIIFQQSKEMAPKDTDEKESSDEVNPAEDNVHREGTDHLVKFIVDKKNIFTQIKEPASDDEEVVQEVKSVKKGNYEQNVGEMTNIEGLPLQKPVVVEEKPETVPEIVSIHDDVVSINPFTNVFEDMEHKNMV